jgi:pyridoxal phosphate enzyme (YggS family)
MAILTADADKIRRNLAKVEKRVAAACAKVDRDPAGVQICVATKYVDAEGMIALKVAGVKIAAENRLQDMISKQAKFRDAFEWHFIGAIQSRKAREIAGHVAVIHSLSTESARDRLEGLENPPKVLVQVNVAGEESKAGISSAELADFIAASPVRVTGLMTMPPLAPDPEKARPYFRALAMMAKDHRLEALSMGTTQDFEVAVEEGATLIRVGSVIFQ